MVMLDGAPGRICRTLGGAALEKEGQEARLTGIPEDQQRVRQLRREETSLQTARHQGA